MTAPFLHGDAALEAWRAEVQSAKLRSRMAEGFEVEPLYAVGPPPPASARRAPATGRTLVVTVATVATRAEELASGADGVLVDGAIELASGERVVLGDPLLDPALARASGRRFAVAADRFHEAGAHAVLELGLALAVFAEQLRALSAAGLSAADVAAASAVTLGVGGDVLLEAAKLRAARAALARLLAVAAPGAPLPWIHARSALRGLSVLDHETNALRVTNGCIAALAAGVEILTPVAFDVLSGSSERGRRLARLTPVVLREEGHLQEAVDPFGGSYAIESLTDEIARRAWDVLREIEKEGGFTAARASVDARIAAAAKERAVRVATRKEVLVGVSKSPRAGDRVPTAPGGRDAEPFERLRARASELRPTVSLVSLGPPAEHAARADFARALFEVGGFAIADAASVVCLCGSDERYAAEAAASAKEHAGRGARVVLAGRPGAREAELRAAGVSAFVFLGCDVPAVLADLMGGAA